MNSMIRVPVVHSLLKGNFHRHGSLVFMWIGGFFDDFDDA
jgi:hypothetical protein